ncbi:glycerol-3-phosphate 1-O-acyltransferase PlsY [Collinsella tanakaei]|uniref:glycerol-3-phosphate 1-O-acyltransferase PlsY n=1 Tax=Collinsella tanakaei TaxID=626935 RepID=UPI001F39AEEB|nr:glycerol-3-phosphate 1-O-acyltransferase PlsY [Collinsella tanakaei]MCF2620841.1 glycerol-3-phosphate 1-O-acyltransferase PlsY [Collinsella tanakaei]
MDAVVVSIPTSATVALVACIIGSYLICGIPFGLILGRIMGHVDIRKSGSGNIGTTNALRVAGPKVAAATLLFDVLKGVICINISRFVIAAVGWGAPRGFEAGSGEDWVIALVALACLYGHIFSPYLKFHGGKGIATGVGILFGYFWPLALIHLAIFIVLVAITKYVSVGSIATAAVVPLTMYIAFPQMSPVALAIWALLGWTVVWAHRGNMKKLAAGNENKLSFSKRADTEGDAS